MLSKEELERYDRHIRIDKIGLEGQKKLRDSNVLVVGAGGLGSPILMYLASIGVGRVGIVDGDIVTLSNLNRQILYNTDDLGKKKALIAMEKIKKLNPYLVIEAYDTWLTDESITRRIFKKYDAVIDATDNYETRYLINKIAVELNKPLFIGAVGRFVGQVMVVIPYETACFNCIFPERDKEILFKLTVENRNQGIIGTTVGITGTLVANEFIKYILGIGSVLKNKLLLIDGLTNEFSIINLEKDPNCKICSKKE
ncbi:HesA/MoeB/ThiF family protein [Caldisericum exile]|uniref:Molybdopterin synthesis protein n=1 Tax=Caldisericum exile (strain DSM 21853 / NBRC 104410 / AZM16c01) TaxID=511051 RepID=A0A7U6GEQ1_CALEA|nr:HesA/MoeB/ThiF family protein [Caldisericum exile]BAL81014.1 putative molybdopterin synthesis protein [Caldisericum exile AZM16c01]